MQWDQSTTGQPAKISPPKSLLKCDYCDHTFSKRDHKKRHERSHTNTKPYVCEFCGRKYARSDVLGRHMQIHLPSGHRPTNTNRSKKLKTDSAATQHNHQQNHPPFSPLDEVTDTADHVIGVQLLQNLSQPRSKPISQISSPNQPSNSNLPLMHHHAHLNPHQNNMPIMNSENDASRSTSHHPQFSFEHNASPTDFTLAQPPTFNHYAAPMELNHHQQIHQGSIYHHPAPPPPPTAPPHLHHHENHPQNQLQQARGSARSHSPTNDAIAQLWQAPLLDFSSLVRPTSPDFSIFSTANTTNNNTNANSPQQMSSSLSSSIPELNEGHHNPHQPQQHIMKPASNAYIHANIRQNVPETSPEHPANRIRNLWPTIPNNKVSQQQAPPLPRADPSLVVDAATADRLNNRLRAGFRPYPLSFPSPHLYTTLLTIYFDRWHPVLPFLHKPTFDPTITSSYLLLSMCTLGALLLDQPDAYELAEAISLQVMQQVTLALSPALLPPAADDIDAVDKIQIVQSSLLRHIYALVSGNRDGLGNARLYHACPINVAYECGIFSSENNNCNNINNMIYYNQHNGEELKYVWRDWARCEIRKRTAYFFLLDDVYYSQLFIVAPTFQSGAVDYPLPCSDALFSANTAARWSELMKITHDSISPYHELAVSIFMDPHSVLGSPALTSLGLKTLISSIFAVVLSTRAHRRQLDSDLDAQPQPVAPLTKALIESLPYIPKHGELDNFAVGVLWHASWMHLLVDMKTIERACGREGAVQQAVALDKLQPWAKTSRARRSILHALDIYIRAGEQGGCTQKHLYHPPHIFISCFQAWMVLQTFLKLNPNVYNFIGPWIRVDWKPIGTLGLGSQPSSSSATGDNSLPGLSNDRGSGITNGTGDENNVYINSKNDSNEDGIGGGSSLMTSISEITKWILYGMTPNPPTLAQLHQLSLSSNNVPRSSSSSSSHSNSNHASLRSSSNSEDRSNEQHHHHHNNSNSDDRYWDLNLQFSNLFRSLGTFPIYENIAGLIELSF